MDTLDYIEREAAKNMEFHLKNLEAINREAHQTVSILIVLVSASLAGAIRFFELEAGVGWGIALALLSVYLGATAIYVTVGCLKLEDVMAPSNEPSNLKHSLGDHALDEIREVELDNLQERIDFNRARNERTGRRLNKARVLICLGPAVFLLAAGVLALISSWTALAWF